MGSQLCCHNTNVTQLHEPDNTKANECIEFFFSQNLQVKETFDEKSAHDKYGFVNKQELLELAQGTYIGRSIDKKMHGNGIMLFSLGMYYEGEWSGGKLQGKGLFIFHNGDSYDGEWKNNLPQGRGIYCRKDPLWIYEGHWIGGKQNGKGKEKFHDGSSYEGEFKNGKRHGQGKFKNPDGRFYEGEFENGKPNGSCQACDFQYIYEGEWKDGKQSGTGKSEWYDDTKQKVEAVYIGEYQEGVKQGFGQYRMKNVVFKGKWEEGTMKETGVLVHSKNKQSL